MLAEELTASEQVKMAYLGGHKCKRRCYRSDIEDTENVYISDFVQQRKDSFKRSV